MFRLLVCFAVMLSTASCNLIIVKKRRYLKGFYVHVPGKNSSTPLRTHRSFIPPAIPVIRHRDTTQPVAMDTGHIPVVHVDTLTRPRTVQAVPPDSVPRAVWVYTNIKDTVARPLPGTTTTVIIIQPGQPPVTTTPPAVVMAPPFPGKDTALPVQLLASATPVFRDSTVHIFPPDTSMMAETADSLSPELPADSFAVDEVRAQSKSFAPVFQNAIVLYGGLSGLQGPSGFPVKTGSFGAGFGWRVTTMLKKRSSLVADFGYRTNEWFISQREPKMAPLTETVHDHERIVMNSLSAGTGLRFQFKPKEKIPPQWIDVTGFGDWTFRTANIYVDDFSDPASAAGRNFHIRTKITNLPYLQRFNYGISARYGRGNISYFAQWRISELVKGRTAQQGADFPQLLIGVEIFTR